jgi:hypothetical protein
MRGFPHLARAAAGIVLAAVLVSCTQVENPRVVAPGQPGVDETRSTMLQRSQFEDVPVPYGFEYMTRGNRSSSYERGGVRVARLVYRGLAPVDEVVAFYHRNMELRAFAWEAVSEEADQDGATLRYKKNQTRCMLSITREAGTTYVQVDVAGPA